MNARFHRRAMLQLLAAPLFASKFTDVTAAAGLSRARNVSGAPIDKRYLVAERRKAYAELQTPPCDTHTCHSCGAC